LKYIHILTINDNIYDYRNNSTYNYWDKIYETKEKIWNKLAYNFQLQLKFLKEKANIIDKSIKSEIIQLKKDELKKNKIIKKNYSKKRLSRTNKSYFNQNKRKGNKCRKLINK